MRWKEARSCPHDALRRLVAWAAIEFIATAPREGKRRPSNGDPRIVKGERRSQSGRWRTAGRCFAPGHNNLPR